MLPANESCTDSAATPGRSTNTTISDSSSTTSMAGCPGRPEPTSPNDSRAFSPVDRATSSHRSISWRTRSSGGVAASADLVSGALLSDIRILLSELSRPAVSKPFAHDARRMSHGASSIGCDLNSAWLRFPKLRQNDFEDTLIQFCRDPLVVNLITQNK